MAAFVFRLRLEGNFYSFPVVCRHPPLPLWERSTRAARRERGRRRRRLLRRRHPLPNPSPIKGEGLRAIRALSFLNVATVPNPHSKKSFQLMFNRILTGIFGSRNERLLRQLNKSVAKINAFEPALQALTDEELRAKTDAFKQRLAAGETLDDLLSEAFAVVREASRRVLGLRHYDVQLIGGMVLHLGKIAEMRTGEGKTLVATLPVYLNALAG